MLLLLLLLLLRLLLPRSSLLLLLLLMLEESHLGLWIHHHLVHIHHHGCCLLWVCHPQMVYHRHHLLVLLSHHLRRHVHWGNTHWLPRCLWPLLLLMHRVSHLGHGLRNAWSCLRLLSLNIWHLIHHVLLRSNVYSCHLLCLKHVYIGNLLHPRIHGRVCPCHHWGYRLSELRGPHSSGCSSHHSRMHMLLWVVLSLSRHSHHCCRTWSHWHARHSSRLELRNWLTCDCGNMLIILI
jgi:hypothetical protein